MCARPTVGGLMIINDVNAKSHILVMYKMINADSLDKLFYNKMLFIIANFGNNNKYWFGLVRERNLLSRCWSL